MSSVLDRFGFGLYRIVDRKLFAEVQMAIRKERSRERRDHLNRLYLDSLGYAAISFTVDDGVATVFLNDHNV